MIAASVMSRDTGRGRIVGFDVETGQVRWNSEHSWSSVFRVQWLPEGEGMLAIATVDERPGLKIWYVPYPRGEPRLITDDEVRYRLASVTADGNSLVTVGEKEEVALWTHRLDGTGRAVRISRSRRDGRFGFDFTGDGRIVFQTLEAGRVELAIMDLDGSRHQILTDDVVQESYPHVTGDGRILYCAGNELRLMEIDGTDSQTLVTLEGPYITTALSPDGSWAAIPMAPGLWRLPLDGGAPTQLTDLEAYIPAISPDGTRLAFYFEEGGQEWIGVTSIESGDLEVTLEGPALLSTSSSILRWAQDGEALIINTAPGDRGNLWRLPLDGGELQRLTNFTDERLFWFEYTPDGETLVVSSGEYVRDAMLIRDFR
jgi:Tol biopolymer transport system component